MKKKHRNITVDGIQYAWMVRGIPETLVIWKDRKIIRQAGVRMTSVTPKTVEETIRETLKIMESKDLMNRLTKGMHKDRIKNKVS